MNECKRTILFDWKAGIRNWILFWVTDSGYCHGFLLLIFLRVTLTDFGYGFLYRVAVTEFCY